MIEADDLDRQRAAEPGQAAAQRKGDGKNLVDVDTERACHALVVDRGAHLRAEARVFERCGDESGDQQRHRDEKEAIGAEALPE